MKNNSSFHAIGFPGGFSVLMSVYYNDELKLFKKAVFSVLRNTIKPNQFVIVLDGPINRSMEIFLLKLEMSHQIIKLVKLKKNIGLASALNVGLKNINFPWVVRADSDDYNLPTRFAELAKLLMYNPSLDLFGSAILEVDHNGLPLFFRKVPISELDIIKSLKFRSPFNHMSVAYRLEKVKSCGGYPEIYLKEDYGLWCKMISNNAKVMNTDKVLVHASAGSSMLKRRGGWRYAKSEFILRNYMVSCGVQDLVSAFVFSIVRATIFLLPIFVRAKIYKSFLRKSI
jgi:glycosyltransferase involved in cell wall biosynthesis